MTNRRIRVVQPTDTVKTLRGAGDEYRCLATGRETDNGVLPGSGDRAAGRRPAAPRADTRGGGVLRAGGRAHLRQRRRTDLGSSGQVSECPEGSTTPLSEREHRDGPDVGLLHARRHRRNCSTSWRRSMSRRTDIGALMQAAERGGSEIRRAVPGLIRSGLTAWLQRRASAGRGDVPGSGR